MIDSCAAEQECADCALSIAVSETGDCCGISYIKSGSMSATSMTQCVEDATLGAKAIWKQLRRYIDAEELSASVNPVNPDVPVHRAGLLV